MKFLVIDDDPTCREAICFLIEDEGNVAEGVPWSERVWIRLKQEAYDAVLMDVDLSRPDALSRVSELHVVYPHLQMVIMVVEQNLRLASEAIDRGVVDILEKPFRREHLVMMIARLERFRQLRQQVNRQAFGAERSRFPGP